MANSSAFPHRLLSAAAGDEPLSDGDALCGEAWVRLGNAVSAAIVRVLSADRLYVHRCGFESGHTVHHSTEHRDECFAALLNERVLQNLFPDPAVGITRQVFAEPVAGWAVVCDIAGADLTWVGGERPDDEMLQALSRRLLDRVPGGLCRFPESRLLEAIAEFSAGAGHEINNPLGSILGQTASLLRTNPTIELRQVLETIGGQAWRIRDMIGNTILFARPPAVVPQSFDPVAAVRKVVDAVREQPGFGTVPVEVRSEPDAVSLTADPAQFSSS